MKTRVILVIPAAEEGVLVVKEGEGDVGVEEVEGVAVLEGYIRRGAMTGNVEVAGFITSLAETIVGNVRG